MDANLWTAVDESRATGLPKPSISKARAKADHPVNGPHRDVLTVGSREHPRAPAREILRWWLAELARPRPGRPLAPETVQQIHRKAAEHGVTLEPDLPPIDPPAGIAGQVTATGRQLVDQHAATAAQPQEQS